MPFQASLAFRIHLQVKSWYSKKSRTCQVLFINVNLCEDSSKQSRWKRMADFYLKCRFDYIMKEATLQVTQFICQKALLPIIEENLLVEGSST